jgi:Trk K+ transport system NAD-binding subunit
VLRSQRRLLLLLAALPVLIVAAGLLYGLGMAWLEGEPRGFWDSLEFAAETLSTTGFGRDNAWSHPAMVTYVIVLQFVGVFLVFLVFPIYLIPVLEERFESRLPKSAPRVGGAVLIFRYSAAVATLIDELERNEVPAVVVEEQIAVARRLVEQGRRVVFGNVDDGVLGRLDLMGARAVVANGSDDENAALILAARQAGYAGELLALVEEPAHRRPMMLAGATAAYTPRHILGAALAARASERLSPRVQGVQAIGRSLVMTEVRVGRQSGLAGRTLGETRIGTRTGVNVLGQWVEGRLETAPTAETRLAPGGILIVAGSEENLGRFAEECEGMARLAASGPVLLAGYGEVGRKVAQLLREVGEEVQVIDKREHPGVDLVGDVMDHELLQRSRLREARAAIVAVDSDAATMFATVILKEHAPLVPVIARVNQAQNVERIHRAGADFALSISQVAGQMLAGRLLGQESISVDPELRVLRVTARGLEGRHPKSLAIRERTGASVVAVERGEAVIVDFEPEFRFADDDAVYICGSEEAVSRYRKLFPQA